MDVELCEEENIEWLELRLAGRVRVPEGCGERGGVAGSGLLACREGRLWVASGSDVLECDVNAVGRQAAAWRAQERAGQDVEPPLVEGKALRQAGRVRAVAVSAAGTLKVACEGGDDSVAISGWGDVLSSRAGVVRDGRGRPVARGAAAGGEAGAAYGWDAGGLWSGGSRVPGLAGLGAVRGAAAWRGGVAAAVGGALLVRRGSGPWERVAAAGGEGEGPRAVFATVHRGEVLLVCSDGDGVDCLPARTPGYTFVVFFTSSKAR
jgi:hypothetical protein